MVDVAKLKEVALKYRENAYAPYSKFKVGAAVVTKAGNIYGGCNIENSSYPLGSCGEKNAIIKAVTEGEREIEAVLIIADTDGPCAPCGMCRQFIAEFKIPRIIMMNLKGDVRDVTLEELLPFAFSENDL